MRPFRVSRDTILFVVGLAGIVFEAIRGGQEQPTLIIAFLGMMGLPLFLNTDERHSPPARRRREQDEEQDEEPVA